MAYLPDDLKTDSTEQLLDNLYQCHLALNTPEEDQNHVEWSHDYDLIRAELILRLGEDEALRRWLLIAPTV